MAALEEELRASARDGQADDLAEAVEAALKNPAAAYGHATLQAAFARYAENKKDKDKDKDRDKKDSEAPTPGKMAAGAAKVVPSPPGHEAHASAAAAGSGSTRRRLRGKHGPDLRVDQRLGHGGGRAGRRDGGGGCFRDQEAPPGWRPWLAGAVGRGGSARRLRPRLAGGRVPCVTVRDSSDGEESLDAYPRWAVSPTQLWPPRSADVGVQMDISVVDARPFGYDEIEMDWGGVDTGRTPSPPPPVLFELRACWAGRSLPVGPRREAPSPAGGPTVWGRAGRHAGKGSGAGGGRAGGVAGPSM